MITDNLGNTISKTRWSWLEKLTNDLRQALSEIQLVKLVCKWSSFFLVLQQRLHNYIIPAVFFNSTL